MGGKAASSQAAPTAMTTPTTAPAGGGFGGKGAGGGTTDFGGYGQGGKWSPALAAARANNIAQSNQVLQNAFSGAIAPPLPRLRPNPPAPSTAPPANRRYDPMANQTQIMSSPSTAYPPPNVLPPDVAAAAAAYPPRKSKVVS